MIQGQQYVRLCVVVFADSFVDFDVYENLMERDGDSRCKKSPDQMKMADRPIWVSKQTVLRSEGTDIAQVKFS